MVRLRARLSRCRSQSLLSSFVEGARLALSDEHVVRCGAVLCRMASWVDLFERWLCIKIHNPQTDRWTTLSQCVFVMRMKIKQLFGLFVRMKSLFSWHSPHKTFASSLDRCAAPDHLRTRLRSPRKTIIHWNKCVAKAVPAEHLHLFFRRARRPSTCTFFVFRRSRRLNIYTFSVRGQPLRPNFAADGNERQHFGTDALGTRVDWPDWRCNCNLLR